MVNAEAHRGFRVSSISKEELLDLTRTRIEIESLCLSKAIEVGDVEWETRIVGAAHRMERLQRSPSDPVARVRSEEHTSELQSLMRTSSAVFCLKKKK